MPRHRQNGPPSRGNAAALDFSTAREQATAHLEACEKAFNDALACAAEMVPLVDSPRRATVHLEVLNELRRLIRRLQRRLDA